MAMLTLMSLPVSNSSSSASSSSHSLEWFEDPHHAPPSPLSFPWVKPLAGGKFEGAAKLIQKVSKGLEVYLPELSEEGEGGTYFMKSKKGKKIAVFKPCDEQPFAANNPKFKDSSVPPPEVLLGIRPEEASKNEVAAYLLDRQFADVPLTVLVECCHHVFSHPKEEASKRDKERPHFVVKTGSLQAFVQADFESWDMGSSRYATREVHRIGILDIRIMNLDRHGGNILVVNKKSNSKPVDPENSWSDGEEDEDDRLSGSSRYHLVPIDHAFSLPDTVRCADLWFEWISWAQANQPFSDESISYIDSINLQNDVQILLSIGIRKECIQTLILTTTLLKLCAVKLKMNLASIARLICRKRVEKPSMLEKLAKAIMDEYSKCRDPQTPRVLEEGAKPVSSPAVEQDLVEFISIAQLVMETQLPPLVGSLTAGKGKIRRNSSISNELYLQQLMADQLKLAEHELAK